MPMSQKNKIFLDAGLIIGALVVEDPRHSESYPIIESARRGDIFACTSVGILSEVYAALTWSKAETPYSPAAASASIESLVAEPSKIEIINADRLAGLKTIELAAKHSLTARRTHDAKHAATAIVAGIGQVFTYDVDDWKVFESDGITISGPPSSIERLSCQ